MNKKKRKYIFSKTGICLGYKEINPLAEFIKKLGWGFIFLLIPTICLISIYKLKQNHIPIFLKQTSTEVIQKF